MSRLDEQNPRSEISEIQDQVSISVDDDRGRDAQVVEITKRSETQKQSRRGAKKFPRSHSTGHSVLVLPGENRERYTLRLPEEFRKEMMTRRLKRTRSCVIVLPREESSRRGYRSGGEGSSRGRRVAWLSERLGRSDRWAFTMTPPFFARSTGSVRSPKVYSDGVEKSSCEDAGGLSLREGRRSGEIVESAPGDSLSR
ncbi:hypothetical protein F0562_005578 [Nyssa sinensis]|uniref:Uncharacterized protein n=1 Tax=Nyssa sinensis TaxID=561372 RepID=A0A5J5AKP1_9ASTE|nr:hypothetical protein F0562_005578 [Nyssa sinensis]